MCKKILRLICFFFLGGCAPHRPPVLSRLSCCDSLKVDPQALSMERQMAQTEAERRCIRESLQCENSQEASLTFPLPTEEELHLAGKLICQHYHNSKTIPQRSELMSLLVKHMPLEDSTEAEARAEGILNLILLD